MSLPKSLILIVSLTLPGCSILDRPDPIPQVKPVEIITIEKPAPVYHPPLPEKILTPALMEQYIADLKAGEAPVNVWYGLPTKGYENLSSNIADTKRYLRQILSIVEYYKNLHLEEQDED
jgi:hypothetical protein